MRRCLLLLVVGGLAISINQPKCHGQVGLGTKVNEEEARCYSAVFQHAVARIEGHRNIV